MDTLHLLNSGVSWVLAFGVSAYFPFSALIWLALEKRAERLRAASSPLPVGDGEPAPTPRRPSARNR